MALAGTGGATPGAPQIVYYETVGKDLKIAKWNSGWSIITVDATVNREKRPSIALDASDYAHIAWYEDGGSLRYTSWNGSGWNDLQIVVPSGVGEYVSIALDSTGKPGIAFYDAVNGDLMYTAWDGSAWTWADPAVDETGVVGQHASLAFNGSNRPRIAYFDATNGDLKYAEWDGSAWDIEVVDSDGSVGTFASLRLTSTGAPCIAYYDVDSKDLKYAWRDSGGIWLNAADQAHPSSKTIDSACDVGQYAALSIDPGDSHPTIAYYDSTNGNLKYAEWSEAASLWVIGTVDAAAANVGQYASLGIDPVTMKMKIAYHDANGIDLLFIQEQ